VRRGGDTGRARACTQQTQRFTPCTVDFHWISQIG
jgi:hypothetical protein